MWNLQKTSMFFFFRWPEMQTINFKFDGLYEDLTHKVLMGFSAVLFRHSWSVWTVRVRFSHRARLLESESECVCSPCPCSFGLDSDLLDSVKLLFCDVGWFNGLSYVITRTQCCCYTQKDTFFVSSNVTKTHAQRILLPEQVQIWVQVSVQPNSLRCSSNFSCKCCSVSD